VNTFPPASSATDMPYSTDPELPKDLAHWKFWEKDIAPAPGRKQAIKTSIAFLFIFYRLELSAKNPSPAGGRTEERETIRDRVYGSWSF